MVKTQCPECGAKYTIKGSRIPHIVGKTATCKVCHARFVVELLSSESPTEHVEQHDNDTTSSPEEAKKTKRRTRAEIRQDTINTLSEAFRKHHQALVQIDEAEKPSVAAVREWIYLVLQDCLGYNEADIVTDVVYGDRRIDILVHENPEDSPKILFHVKNTRRSLNQKLIEQAKADAFALGVPYAVVTNGAVWLFFRADKTEGENKFIEIYETPILDEDGVSDDDAEALYLLSKRALQCGDTEKSSHQVAALQPHRLANALLDDAVLGKINRVLSQIYKSEAGVNVNIDIEVLKQKVEESLGLSDL